jgi:hypothetical protein
VVAAASRAHDGDDQVRVQAVGDERLGPVESETAVLAIGACCDGLEVRAGLRLGHRDPQDEIARHDPRHPALELLGVAELEEVRKRDVVLHRERQRECGQPPAGGLLVEDRVEAKVVDPGTAVVLGHREP